MFFLMLSIVALAVGPLLARVARQRPWAVDFADGFVVVAVGGLVVLHVIPSSIEIGGPWVLVAALAGLVAPLAFERFERAASGRANALIAGLVLAGVAVHALLDGAAMLEVGGAPAARALAISVVVHRIPVGLAIWWLVRPKRGIFAAITLLAVEAGGGIVGFLLGGPLLSGAFAPHLSLFQAALAGALLHVLAHHAPSADLEEEESHHHVHAYDEAHEGEVHHHPTRFASGLGALAAIAFVAFVTREHPVAHPELDELDAHAAFLAMARAVSLPLLLACVVAGVAHVLLPQTMPTWLSRGKGATGALRGLVIGMLLPVCSCGIVPLHRTLADRRLAPSTAAGLLVASPELGPAALFLSFALLGPVLAFARISAAAVAAVVIAFLFTYMARQDNALPSDDDSAVEKPTHHSLVESLMHALRFGFVEMLDHTAPWLLAGLIAAALAEPTIPRDAFASVSPTLAVVAAALIGVPFYVSASAAMPLLAVLMHKGLSPGATVAFLLTGPAVTPATVTLLSARFGIRPARIFAVAAVAVAVVSGIAVDRFGNVPGAFDLHLAPSLLQNLALPAIELLILASLIRQGPRAMLAKLLASG
ncbi:MAG: permease [Polyangiaceae bacterium]